MEEFQLRRQVGIARVFQLREQVLRKLLRADDHFPDFADNRLQEVEPALLSSNDALPVPLIDIGRMVVIEEIIFTDGAHIGADAFADSAIELLEGDAFPLGRRLHDLRVHRMQVAIVRDVELNRGARPVAIQHVVDSALHIHNERDFDHHQVEFLAQAVLDIAFYLVQGLLRLFRGQQGAITLRQNFFQLLVIADSRPSQVGFLIQDKRAHEHSPLRTDSVPARPSLRALSKFGIKRRGTFGGHRACGIALGFTFELGLLQDDRDGQQNSNQAKYHQREQSHHWYRHSYTSLAAMDCLSRSLATL